jgi:hypothetical protein
MTGFALVLSAGLIGYGIIHVDLLCRRILARVQ